MLIFFNLRGPVRDVNKQDPNSIMLLSVNVLGFE